MTHFEIFTDTEKAERIGAAGTFQVIEVRNEEGDDVTEQLGIDAGRHWRNDNELAEFIASALGVPASEVSLDIE
jgi:hypothetical protein